MFTDADMIMVATLLVHPSPRSSSFSNHDMPLAKALNPDAIPYFKSPFLPPQSCLLPPASLLHPALLFYYPRLSPTPMACYDINKQPSLIAHKVHCAGSVRGSEGPRLRGSSRDRADGSRMSQMSKNVAEIEKKDHLVIEEKTSLMIRHVPNQFKRSDLMHILDKHCQEQNLSAEKCAETVRSEYDFLYLPMDFKQRANLGYAFVNFTNSAGASRFSKEFHGFSWEVSQNKKTCEISFAIIQGKDALADHFKNSLFPCHTDAYLPVVLSPPRNGFHHSTPILVGKRVDDISMLPTIVPVKRRRNKCKKTKLCFS